MNNLNHALGPNGVDHRMSGDSFGIEKSGKIQALSSGGFFGASLGFLGGATASNKTKTRKENQTLERTVRSNGSKIWAAQRARRTEIGKAGASKMVSAGAKRRKPGPLKNWGIGGAVGAGVAVPVGFNAGHSANRYDNKELKATIALQEKRKKNLGINKSAVSAFGVEH